MLRAPTDNVRSSSAAAAAAPAGLSKLARLSDMFARRLQIQERLTRQIAEAVRDAVGAAGVAVMAECV